MLFFAVCETKDNTVTVCASDIHIYVHMCVGVTSKKQTLPYVDIQTLAKGQESVTKVQLSF